MQHVHDLRQHLRFNRTLVRKTAYMLLTATLATPLAALAPGAPNPAWSTRTACYAPAAFACSSRAYCVGGLPTCRVNATLKVLAEL